MRVKVKGSFVQWCPKTIYITSNIEPAFWYPNAREVHREALMRRIDDIEEMADEWVPPVPVENEVIDLTDE